MKYMYDSLTTSPRNAPIQHCNSNASVHFAIPLPTVTCNLSPVTWIHTFSAKEKDTETGLSYFGARYYSSDLSIWLSVDPMAEIYPGNSPNVYCGNNPISNVDEYGMDFVDFNLEYFLFHDPPQKKDPKRPNSQDNPYVLDDFVVKAPTKQTPSPSKKESAYFSIPYTVPMVLIRVGEAVEIAVATGIASFISGLSVLMQGDTRPL